MVKSKNHKTDDGALRSWQLLLKTTVKLEITSVDFKRTCSTCESMLRAGSALMNDDDREPFVSTLSNRNPEQQDSANSTHRAPLSSNIQDTETSRRREDELLIRACLTSILFPLWFDLEKKITKQRILASMSLIYCLIPGRHSECFQCVR